MGPCTGGAALSAALSDFVFMVKKTSYMYVAPLPPGINPEELGEARMHSRVSGCCDVLAEDDEDCLQKCKEFLRFLPLNNLEKPPLVDTGDDPNRRDEELLELVPVETSKWFDMRQLIRHVVDNQHYFELKKDYAANLTTGLARLNGQTVGIIGNNSIWRGGCHDVNASDKHGRFTRFSDAFNIPLIYFADSPAFYPSVEEEKRGILRHGCMVIHSTAEATVPQITLYIRKCFGGGNLAMPCNILKADRLIGWPSADRGLMSPEGMMSILWRKQLSAAKTPEEVAEVRREGIKAMEETIKRSTRTATESFIDPRETRPTLIRELKHLANKTGERPWRKHENINL
jgi:acetyl-CoA carboxylase carboxyltransferase component